MKIKILQPIAGNANPRFCLAEFGFAPGSIIDVDPELAEIWVKADIALPAKKGDDLSMPVEAYTLKLNHPLVVAYNEAEDAAEAKADAEAAEAAAAQAAAAIAEPETDPEKAA